VALFQTTWHSGIINLVNGGDFVVSEEQFVVSFSYLIYSRSGKEHLVQFYIPPIAET
jgi:hypothetical protein